MMDWDRLSLEEWQRYQPLSVLQLDQADRAVLRVAGNRGTCLQINQNLMNAFKETDSTNDGSYPQKL